jgi:hypothetical protein
VWSALVLTLLFAGPRAWAVTRARAANLAASMPAGPHVDLDRVGFVAMPPWLRGDLLTAVALDLAPVLHGEVGLTDEARAGALIADLRRVPWVADVALQRAYPNRLRALLTLREPVARLHTGGVAVLLAADGVCLPAPARIDLPEIDVLAPVMGEHGIPHPDPAVRAAAAVAAEWVHEVAAQMPHAPALRRVDVRNLGYRHDPARLCEVTLAVASAEGLVWLDYDHPPGSDAPRVPAATKSEILRQLLRQHPDLRGIARADLRFKNRWQAWVEAAPVRQPP